MKKYLFDMNENCILKWTKIIITIIALTIALFQLGQIDKQLAAQQKSTKWQNYNLVNRRYADLIANIPTTISNHHKNFNHLSEKDKIWVRRYFNLTSEEYWMQKKGLLPAEMWEERIVKGVCVNLREYPLLISGFLHFKKKSAFNHPEDFSNLIDNLIRQIRSSNHLTSIM